MTARQSKKREVDAADHKRNRDMIQQLMSVTSFLFSYFS